MEIVGCVGEDELKIICNLFEKRLALQNLMKITSTSNECAFSRMESDLMGNEQKIENWWKKSSKKYNWKSKEGSSWLLDFSSGDIILE